MKRKFRRFLSLLLTCVMMCVPAAQVMASASYDVTADDVSQTVLFPGDILTGLDAGTVLIMDDGTQTTADYSWENTSDNIAYEVSWEPGYEEVVAAEEEGAEDQVTYIPGTVYLTVAGYVLTVTDGTSVTALDKDNGGTTDNYYEPTDEEEQEAQNSDTTTETAFYQSGETVTITADEPEDGYVFAGWVTDTESGVTIADASSSVTTITMPTSPEKMVSVTATYTLETEAETPAPETAAPETSAEETAAPEASAEETAAPEASVEETTAPEASVEETAAPEASAEETTAPEASAEETTAPETTASEPVSSDSGSSDDLIVIVTEDEYNSNTETEPSDDLIEIVSNEVTVTVNCDIGTEEYALSYTDTYAAGDPVEIIAEDLTADGYDFSYWFVSSLNVSLEEEVLTDDTVTFTMPETSVVLIAVYTVAETEAPVEETTAPETAAAETNAPETAAEETAAPETAAAETSAPETTAPETTAPETELTDLPSTADEPIIEILDETESTSESGTEAAPESETETESETEPVTYSVIVDGTVVGSYAEGETVTVAQPAASTGYVFSSWMISNDASITLAAVGDGTWTFTMPAGEVSLSSIFDVATYTVSVVNGTTGSGAASGSFEYGSTVSIAADTAADGMTFDHWESSGSTDVTFENESSATTSFTMPNGDVEVTAVYVNLPNTYTVQVSNGLIDGTYTQHTYEEGTKITVTANAGTSGQEFSGWTVNGGSYDLGSDATSSSVTVTVTEDLIFVANYTGVKYKVTLTNGSADYTECTAGTTVTITAADPAAGYAFDYWTVDTANATLANSSSSTTTFTMPAADVTLTAVYKQVQYTVTIENGSTSQTYYYYGDTVTVSANYPASGKEFSAWTTTSGNVTFADASRSTTTFTMPAGNVTISATYEDGPTASENYISGVSEGESYAANEKLTFTAVGAGMSNTDPNPGDIRFVPTGYQIGNVSNTWTSSPYETSMSIKSTGEYTLKVSFARQVYDGSSWVADGTTSTTSVTFNIVTSSEAVNTGDTTPLLAVGIIAAVACLVFIVLLVVFIVRRRRDQR